MSSKMSELDRSKERERAAEAFDLARELHTHDRLYVSDACRQRIEAIQAAARQRRAEMHEEQAMSWEDDVREEKKRLLLEKAAPVLKPGQGFTRGAKPSRKTEADLTLRAERNVTQDNERALGKTHIVEDSLINVAVLEDQRAFEVARAGREEERGQQSALEESAKAPGELERLRESFARTADRDDGGRDM